MMKKLKSLPSSSKTLLKKLPPDYLLLSLYFAFLSLSILLVYSTSVPFSLKETGNPHTLFQKHLISIVLSLFTLLIGFRIPIKMIRRFNGIITLLIFGLLLGPFIPSIGVEIGGTRRWLSIFGIQFQPSEIVRILSIFYFAHQLSRWENEIKSPEWNKEKGMIILYASLVGFIILLQKDFSTTVVYFLTVAALFFMAQMPFKLLFSLFIGAILSLLPFALLSPYRLERIQMLLNLEKKPENAYQIYQALHAFERGGVFGLGPGNGKHNIPYIFNDFIYAAAGEELGFVGGFFILILFFFFLYRGFRIASLHSKENTYFVLLSFGLTFSIVAQAITNIAVNMVLIFPTGIALPFLSYGGTSLLMSSFCLGILLQISQKKDFI